MRSHYEEARKRTLLWEKKLEEIRGYVGDCLQNIDSVRATTWNLYKEMCRRKGDEIKFNETDLEHQFLYIKRTMKNLEGVTIKAKEIIENSKHKTNEYTPLRVVWKVNFYQESSSTIV